MSTIQDTLVPMGLTRTAAADMSKEIVKLAVDLGSFNNLPTEDVIRDIQSALVGNHETMRKYGVVISETTLKSAGMAAGLADAKGEMSEQAKLLARLTLIQGGTTDAQGDAIRTAGSFANRLQGLKAAFKSLRVEVGKQIIEGAGLGGVLDGLTVKVGAFIKSIQESGIIEQWAKKAKDVLETISLIAKAGMEDKGDRAQIFESMGKIILLYLEKGALTIVSILAKAAGPIGTALGEAALAVLAKVPGMKAVKWGKDKVEDAAAFWGGVSTGSVSAGVEAMGQNEIDRGSKPSAFAGIDAMLKNIGSRIADESSKLTTIADKKRIEVAAKAEVQPGEMMMSAESMAAPVEAEVRKRMRMMSWATGGDIADRPDSKLSTWKQGQRWGDRNGQGKLGEPMGKSLGGWRVGGGPQIDYSKAVQRSGADLGDIFTRMYKQGGAIGKDDVAKKQLSALEKIADNTDNLKKPGLK
jgi:hypothetical protein